MVRAIGQVVFTPSSWYSQSSFTLFGFEELLLVHIFLDLWNFFQFVRNPHDFFFFDWKIIWFCYDYSTRSHFFVFVLFVPSISKLSPRKKTQNWPALESFASECNDHSNNHEHAPRQKHHKMERWKTILTNLLLNILFVDCVENWNPIMGRHNTAVLIYVYLMAFPFPIYMLVCCLFHSLARSRCPVWCILALLLFFHSFSIHCSNWTDHWPISEKRRANLHATIRLWPREFNDIRLCNAVPKWMKNSVTANFPWNIMCIWSNMSIWLRMHILAKGGKRVTPTLF